MKIRYGKNIDSFTLKKDLDKRKSIESFREACSVIRPGVLIKNCPICGNNKRKIIQTIYSFTYYQCSSCEVVYVSNPPDNKSLEALYNSQFYSEGVTKVLRANENVIDYRRKNIACPKVEYVLENMSTTKETWLDIGCGVGEILSVALEKGFKCLGVETNKFQLEFAQKKFKIDIVNDYIDENNLEQYRHNWGIISLFGVLEHLIDPVAIIKTICKIQTKDDNLVIEVPHFPAISAYSQLTFPNEINRLLLPPLHLFLFSVKSMETLLEAYSYEVTNIWYFGQDFYEFFSTLSLFAENLNNSILHEKISPLINDFQKIIDKNELSDEILVIARKTV
jgi:SAM-dependent methyltransferase